MNAMVMTLDIPRALADKVRRIAAERGTDDVTLATEFIQKGADAAELESQQHRSGISVDPSTGWPTFSSGQTVSREDVRAMLLEDEEFGR